MRSRSTAWVRIFSALLFAALPATLVGAVERLVPDDFDTIQAAIDASADGDVVIVATGSYTENLSLKSGVDVRGREAARTILLPSEVTIPVVLASDIDDVTFGNFTVAEAQIGVDVIGSTNLQIVNTIFDTATQFGLRVDIDSTVDSLNNVFWENAVAITRSTIDVQVTNTAFVRNVVTITSPIGIPVSRDANVDNCGFFTNADLNVAGVDSGLGDNFVVGDPLFVDTEEGDFHLREGSPFIDTGIGVDSIDNSIADIGAYGGQFADPMPFPLPAPTLSDVSDAIPPPYGIEVSWSANLAYRVTSSLSPGSYRVYYVQNESGPPYNGTDAGSGTLPSPVEAGTATTFILDNLQPAAPAPDTPQLLSADALNQSVALTWSAVSEATAYQVYWGITSIDENSSDVGDVTAFTVTGLANDATYLFAVSALQKPVYHVSVTSLDHTQNRNESDFSPEDALAIGPSEEGARSNTLSASPAITIPYPDLPDKGCFIATAAFGADWEAEVLALREFRDRYLETNRPGRAFVAWYYRHGPAAARAIEGSNAARAVVRWILYLPVALALVLMHASNASLGALTLLSGSLLVSIGYRRRASRVPTWGRLV